MIIICPKCHAHFKLNDSLIRGGSRFRCSKCLHIFKVEQKTGQTASPVTKELTGLFDNFKTALLEVLESGKLVEDFWRKTQSVESKTPQPAHHLSSDETAPLIKKLAGLLKQNDMEAENYLNQLKDQVMNAQTADVIKKMEEHINQLNFQDAYLYLVELADALGVSLTGDEYD